jgi:16S rRNA (cytidine1402-2'-O)-methyltransferase
VIELEIKTEENEEKKGILYLVSTPIGNWDDITLRAIKVLKNCDRIICEEGKEGAKILRQYNIHKEIELLNEQNEDERTLELILELEKGKHFALISDCGTPVFADPGFSLVKTALKKNIEISVIPGASSLMAGIVRSGFAIKEFLFAGFLSRIKEERISQLKELSKERRTVALLETPYRLMPFLEAAKSVMPHRQVYIGCNLTMPYETHHYGTFTELYNKFSEKKFKGEFIVIFEGLPKDSIIDESDTSRMGYDRPRRQYQSNDKFDRPRRKFQTKDESDRPRRKFQSKDESDRPRRKFQSKDDKYKSDKFSNNRKPFKKR